MTETMIAPNAPIAVDSIGAARVSIATGRGSLTRVRLIAMVVLLFLVLVVGTFTTSSTRYALILGTVYAIVILGNNAVTAVLGEINLGAGASLAIGAYSAAYFMGEGIPVPVAALLAIALTTIVGGLLSIAFTRLTGIFTALVTFALVFALPSLAVFLAPITGGATGRSLPIDPVILGVTLGGSNVGMLGLVVIVFIVMSIASMALLNGRPGRTGLVVGEATAAAAVFGVNVKRTKILTWTWAAFVGGLGGVLYGLTVGYVSPTQFDPFLSITLLVGGIIGGVRSPYGAWIGGALIGVLPTQLQEYIPASATGFAFGLILLGTLAIGGKGLAELIERFVLWIRVRMTRTAS